MPMTKFIMGVFLLGGLALLGWMVRQVGITDLIASCQIVGFWIVPYFLLKSSLISSIPLPGPPVFRGINALSACGNCTSYAWPVAPSIR